MSEQLLVAISSEMNRIADAQDTIAETQGLLEARMHALETSLPAATRMLHLEAVLRKIHAIVTNDSWRLHQDRADIAGLVSEALNAGTQPLVEHPSTQRAAYIATAEFLPGPVGGDERIEHAFEDDFDC